MNAEKTVTVDNITAGRVPSLIILTDGAATDSLAGPFSNPTKSSDTGFYEATGYFNEFGNKTVSFTDWAIENNERTWNQFVEPFTKEGTDWMYKLVAANEDGVIPDDDLTDNGSYKVLNSKKENNESYNRAVKLAKDYESSMGYILLSTLMTAGYMKAAVSKAYNISKEDLGVYTISVDMTDPTDPNFKPVNENKDATKAYAISSNPAMMDPGKYFNEAWVDGKYGAAGDDPDGTIYNQYTIGSGYVRSIKNAINAFKDWQANKTAENSEAIKSVSVYRSIGSSTNLNDKGEKPYISGFNKNQGDHNSFWIVSNETQNMEIPHLEAGNANNPYGLTDADVDVNYVTDSYYASTADDAGTSIASAFDKVFNTRGTPAFKPSEGQNSVNFQGLTYSDPIGKYMEIKTNGIIADSNEQPVTTADGSVKNYGDFDSNGEKLTDMALELYGNMYCVEKTAKYDANYIKQWKENHPGEEFKMGWYLDGENVSDRSTGPNHTLWEIGAMYYLDESNAKQYLAQCYGEGVESDPDPEKVYTFYRVDGRTKGYDEEFLREDLANPCYEIKQDAAGHQTPTVTFKRSDIRIWVEDSGAYTSSGDSDLGQDTGYDQMLYLNIAPQALPLQVTTLEFTGSRMVAYKTNLKDNASLPVRLFYTVGLRDDIMSEDGLDVDLSKVSQEYLSKNKDINDDVTFYSNYYDKSLYESGGGTDANQNYGNAAVAFSVGSSNQYYIFQQNTPIFSNAYIYQDGKLIDVGTSGADLSEWEGYLSPSLTGDRTTIALSKGKTEDGKPNQAALDALSALDPKPENGEIILLPDDVITTSVRSAGYYFMPIKYYVAGEEFEDETDGGAKKNRCKQVVKIVTRQGKEFGSMLNDAIETEEDMSGAYICWYDSSGTTSQTFPYLKTGTRTTNKPTKETWSTLDTFGEPVSGEWSDSMRWIVATRVGGCRAGEMSRHSRSKSDGEMVDEEGNSIEPGNNTETAPYSYMPGFGLGTDSTNLNLVNYMGNNGKLSIEDTVLAITKELEGYEPAEDEEPPRFSYDLVINNAEKKKGLEGDIGVIKLTKHADATNPDEYHWDRVFDSVTVNVDPTTGFVLAPDGSPALYDGYYYKVNADYSSGSVNATGGTDDNDSQQFYVNCELYTSPDAEGATGTNKDLVVWLTVLTDDGGTFSGESGGENEYADDFQTDAVYSTITLHFGYSEANRPEVLKSPDELPPSWLAEIDVDPAAPEYEAAKQAKMEEYNTYLTEQPENTATFTLGDGEGILLNGLDSGTDYKVTENLSGDQVSHGFDLVSVSQNMQNGVITYDKNHNVLESSGSITGNVFDIGTTTDEDNVTTKYYSISGDTGTYQEEVHFVNGADTGTLIIDKDLKAIGEGELTEEDLNKEFEFEIILYKDSTNAEGQKIKEPVDGFFSYSLFTYDDNYFDSSGEKNEKRNVLASQARRRLRFTAYDEATGEVADETTPSAYGKATIKLKGRQELRLYALPMNTKYEIREVNWENSEFIPDDLDGVKDGTIQKNDSQKEIESRQIFGNTKLGPANVSLFADKRVVDERGAELADKLKDGDYRFLLTAAQTNPEGDPLAEESITDGSAGEIPEGQNALKILTNKDDGSYNGNIEVFNNVRFTRAGEYTYYLREINSEGGNISGITYSDAVYKIVVTVSPKPTKENNAAERVLEAKVSVYKNDSTEPLADGEHNIIFENVYRQIPVSLRISGLKTLLSGKLKGGEFEFELYQSDYSPLGAAANISLATADDDISEEANNEDGSESVSEAVNEGAGDGGNTSGSGSTTQEETAEPDNTGSSDEAQADEPQIDEEQEQIVDEGEEGDMAEPSENSDEGEAEFVYDSVDIEGNAYVDGESDTPSALDAVVNTATVAENEGDEAVPASDDDYGISTINQYPRPEYSNRVYNNADGIFDFGSIEYDETGIYTYEISERNSKDLAGFDYDRVNFDPKEYILTVTVDKLAEGEEGYDPTVEKLKLSYVLTLNGEVVSSSDDGNLTTALEFDNELRAYEPAVTITKTLDEATASRQPLRKDDTAVFNVTVENTGELDLANTVIEDLLTLFDGEEEAWAKNPTILPNTVKKITTDAAGQKTEQSLIMNEDYEYNINSITLLNDFKVGEIIAFDVSYRIIQNDVDNIERTNNVYVHGDPKPHDEWDLHVYEPVSDEDFDVVKAAETTEVTTEDNPDVDPPYDTETTSEVSTEITTSEGPTETTTLSIDFVKSVDNEGTGGKSYKVGDNVPFVLKATNTNDVELYDFIVVDENEEAVIDKAELNDGTLIYDGSNGYINDSYVKSISATYNKDGATADMKLPHIMINCLEPGQTITVWAHVTAKAGGSLVNKGHTSGRSKPTPGPGETETENESASEETSADVVIVTEGDTEEVSVETTSETTTLSVDFVKEVDNDGTGGKSYKVGDNVPFVLKATNTNDVGLYDFIVVDENEEAIIDKAELNDGTLIYDGSSGYINDSYVKSISAVYNKDGATPDMKLPHVMINCLEPGQTITVWAHVTAKAGGSLVNKGHTSGRSKPTPGPGETESASEETSADVVIVTEGDTEEVSVETTSETTTLTVDFVKSVDSDGTGGKSYKVGDNVPFVLKGTNTNSIRLYDFIVVDENEEAVIDKAELNDGTLIYDGSSGYINESYVKSISAKYNEDGATADMKLPHVMINCLEPGQTITVWAHVTAKAGGSLVNKGHTSGRSKPTPGPGETESASEETSADVVIVTEGDTEEVSVQETEPPTSDGPHTPPESTSEPTSYSIELHKDVVGSTSGYRVGSVVNYQIKATNANSVSLKDFTLYDSRPEAVIDSISLVRADGRNEVIYDGINTSALVKELVTTGNKAENVLPHVILTAIEAGDTVTANVHITVTKELIDETGGRLVNTGYSSGKPDGGPSPGGGPGDETEQTTDETIIYETVTNDVPVEETTTGKPDDPDDPDDPGNPPGGGGSVKYSNITVHKVWKDNNNADGLRPDGISVNLLRDGDVYKSVVLDDSNNWEYTWTQLTSGHEWDVEEVDVPEGYVSSVNKKDGDFTITNSIPGEDEPNDENDPDGNDPEGDNPTDGSPNGSPGDGGTPTTHGDNGSDDGSDHGTPNDNGTPDDQGNPNENGNSENGGGSITERLPQTGMPVIPALASIVLGVAALAIGLKLRRKNK